LPGAAKSLGSARTLTNGECRFSFARFANTKQERSKHGFTVIFEKEDEGGYHVFCPTLPVCHTQSETLEEGIENIREAIEVYIESLVQDGLRVPEDILIKPIEIST